MGEGSGFPTLLDDIVFIRVVGMNPCSTKIVSMEAKLKQGLDENPNIQIKRGRKDHTKRKPNLRQK